jgi:hypothetical protein
MLVLHGREDTMASPERAERFAKAGARRTWAPLPGGHFAFLYERDSARDTLVRWLTRLDP